MDLWSSWWFWLSFAAVLGILEVVIPAFVFLGFALGAAAMGALLGVSLIDITPAWSFVLFAVLSVVAYAILRLIFGRHHGQVRHVERDINEN